ncbi:MAG: hypothetical protein J7M25_05185 [Deltaproteobacteria bacterium]|nr:hypothetical protein [Deltaproteobacteria bacterium]
MAGRFSVRKSGRSIAKLAGTVLIGVVMMTSGRALARPGAALSSWGIVTAGPQFRGFDTSHFMVGGGVVVEGGGTNWIGARLAVGGGWWSTKAEVLDSTSRLAKEAMLTASFGPVIRVSGFPCIAHRLGIPLELFVAPQVEVLANRPLVVIGGVLGLGVGYRFGGSRSGRGFYVALELDAGWYHVMSELYQGDFKVGFGYGSVISVGYHFEMTSRGL